MFKNKNTVLADLGNIAGTVRLLNAAQCGPNVTAFIPASLIVIQHYHNTAVLLDL